MSKLKRDVSLLIFQTLKRQKYVMNKFMEAELKI